MAEAKIMLAVRGMIYRVPVLQRLDAPLSEPCAKCDPGRTTCTAGAISSTFTVS